MYDDVPRPRSAVSLRTPLDADLPAEADLPDVEGPRPRLSVLRVLAALVVLAAAAGGVFLWARTTIANSGAGPVATTWYAAYVDATLTPVYQFQDATANPDRQVDLGFVVSAGKGSCTPSWGHYYSLSGAQQSLQLDSRIVQFQQDGGTAIISFGGKANQELALTCTNTASLEAAYRSVIDRYRVTTVDFDIEGAALTDWAAVQRRARAVAALQRSVHTAHGHLAVWLTVPSQVSGLTDAGISVVDEMLRAGVSLAGVNAMAMDFGGPQANMLQAVKSDAASVHRQLAQSYEQLGYSLSSREVWARQGLTVMIGQNDTAGESFGLTAARGLASYAADVHLGRLSIWSLDRDAQCGSSFAEVGIHSNTCSGVPQSALAFDHFFAGHLVGAVGSSVLAPRRASGPVTAANDPYPLWQPTVPYQRGYKIVRDNEIYQAKWYNQGDDPAQQVQYSYQTPWQLIGPVLSSDHAPTTTTLPPTAAPAWSATTPYPAGTEVLFAGLPYDAKWYNQGSSPAQAATDPTGSPWRPLFTVPGEPPAG